MDPIPISSYAINLILQYISPPSQLTRPIPSNLLSRSLLQRHALLEISPHDPSAYLSWPSSDRDRAIHYLESLQMPLDEQAPDLLIGYTIDPEHAYAHVHIKPTGDDGLRLIFEWDGEESWKYHDATVMPFPPGTRPFLGDPAAQEAISVSPQLGGKQAKGGNGDDDDDDEYWNSYGVEDDSGAKLLPSTSKSEMDVSEDAYWARYVAVQGTTDSTVPSPLQKGARRPEAVPVAHHISREEIIPTLNPNIYSRLRDPKGPPSPTTLAHRLAELSPRPSNSSPLSYRRSAPDPDEDNPGATDDGSESRSSLLDENPWEWALQGNRKEGDVSSAATTDPASRQRINQDDDNRAVQDAVRGLFWLWKTKQRPDSPPEGNGEKSTEELARSDFLQLVGRAIAVPK